MPTFKVDDAGVQKWGTSLPVEKKMSSLSKSLRKMISPSESKSLSIPGGIESSGTRNVSTSSIRKSLSTTGIREEEGYLSTKGIEGVDSLLQFYQYVEIDI
ncbi:hypothetical protein Tco_0975207 [Tanacetum coccineum]|uniref:Uncharacterized protein n=1 Tax=Tanacetum coccineum TaxID=301880 RepID=A0ABQ5EDS0_9ASTR